MGTSESKVARAAGSAARKYPARTSAHAPPTSRPTPSTTTSTSTTKSSTTKPSPAPGPKTHNPAQASFSRNQAIDLDARDPDFASRLSHLGPVDPYPTYSPSSRAAATATRASSSPADPTLRRGVFPNPAANPAMTILAARQRIQEMAEQEKVGAGRKGFEGRTFADVATVRKVLALRDEQGMPAGEIEAYLGLRKGTVARLGRVGVVEAA